MHHCPIDGRIMLSPPDDSPPIDLPHLGLKHHGFDFVGDMGVQFYDCEINGTVHEVVSLDLFTGVVEYYDDSGRTHKTGKFKVVYE